MLVGTLTHSLLPRGYSQFASCLRRDPNKGTERKRPYSPRSRALKAAFLRMDRSDISACNPSFVRPISMRLEIGCPRSYYSAWTAFQSFLCVSGISGNPSIANAKNLAQVLLLFADVTRINPPVVPVTSLRQKHGASRANVLHVLCVLDF